MGAPIKTVPVGATFGSWTVIGETFASGGHAHAFCQCACGAIRKKRLNSIRRGDGTRCKSCSQQQNAQRMWNRRRGVQSYAEPRSGVPEWLVWSNMRHRCQDRKDVAYPSYGGRGIVVCARWESFEAFYTDMGPRPSARHSIERIDNDGNYEPSNCRWATVHEQIRNKRQTRRITFRGRTMCLTDWAIELGMNRGTLESRLNKGWSVRRALTESVDITKRNGLCR